MSVMTEKQLHATSTEMTGMKYFKHGVEEWTVKLEVIDDNDNDELIVSFVM